MRPCGTNSSYVLDVLRVNTLWDGVTYCADCMTETSLCHCCLADGFLRMGLLASPLHLASWLRIDLDSPDGSVRKPLLPHFEHVVLASCDPRHLLSCTRLPPNVINCWHFLHLSLSSGIAHGPSWVHFHTKCILHSMNGNMIPHLRHWSIFNGSNTSSAKISCGFVHLVDCLDALFLAPSFAARSANSLSC